MVRGAIHLYDGLLTPVRLDRVELPEEVVHEEYDSGRVRLGLREADVGVTVVADSQKNGDTRRNAFHRYRGRLCSRLPHFSGKERGVQEALVEVPDCLPRAHQRNNLHGEELAEHQAPLKVAKKRDPVDPLVAHLKALPQDTSDQTELDFDFAFDRDPPLNLGGVPDRLAFLQHIRADFKDALLQASCKLLLGILFAEAFAILFGLLNQGANYGFLDLIRVRDFLVCLALDNGLMDDACLLEGRQGLGQPLFRPVCDISELLLIRSFAP